MAAWRSMFCVNQLCCSNSPSLHRIELVLDEVKSRVLGFGFPPDFERAFRDTTRRQRLIHARIAMLVGAAIYDVFLVIDHSMIPARFTAAVAIRTFLTVVIPPFFWLPYRKNWVLELLYSTVFLVPWGAGLLYLYTGSTELLAAGQAGLLVVLMYEIATLRPRVPYVAIAIGSFIVMDAIFLSRQAAMPLPFRACFLALITTAGAIALLGGVWLERQERTEFLLRLHIQAQNRELLGRNVELTRLSSLDPLTGIGNRRSFDRDYRQAWEQCAAAQASLAVLLIDLDDFKKLNDVHGHANGDSALREVAASLRHTIRGEQDILARYGGEEFVIVLPNRRLAEAVAIGERICEAVRRTPMLPGSDDAAMQLTVSVGIAAETPCSMEPEELVRQADEALYRAKRNGRDQVYPPMGGGWELAERASCRTA